MIRKATEKDVDSITRIYDSILDREENGQASIGWARGVYPTRDTARSGVERGDMYVFEDNETHEIVAAAVVNHTQMDSYAGGKWSIEAEGDEVMVLHTLVVDPRTAGKGVGKAFVAFYEETAHKAGCKTLRMDTQAKNTAARALYRRLGYKEIGIVACDFNGIEGIQLVLLEKVL